MGKVLCDMKKLYIKKAGRLAILSTVILIVFLFSSCTLLVPSRRMVPVTIDEFMVKTENKDGADQTLAEMSAMIGIPMKVSGDVIITEEKTEELPIIRVYNLTDGKLLRMISDGCPVGFVSDHLTHPENAQGIFYVNHHNIMYICNSDGEEAITAFHDVERPSGEGDSEDGENGDGSDGGETLIAPLFTDSLNGFAYNGVEYFVRDGAVVYEDARPLESDYFNASVAYRENHYYISDTLVFVFDKEGTLVYEYHLPSYAQNAHIFVLGGGDIFVQYTYEAIEGEDYDFIMDEKNHKIVSILYNLKKDSETMPLLSFLVSDMQNAFTDEDFHERYTEKVSNLARVMEISNRRIDVNTPARYSVLSDVLLEVFTFKDVVNGALDITRVSRDRHLVTTAAGGLLVAGDGSLIGQLNNYRCITEKFILTSGAIYDHDLNMLFDLIKEEYTYYSSVGENIILSKVDGENVGLYLFSRDEPVYLGDASVFALCFEGYSIAGEDGYSYYDENANLILTVKDEITWIYEKREKDRNTHVGYLVGENGNVSYYRLQYTPLSIIR